MAQAICSVDGCDRPYCAKGYCRPHWRLWRKYGDPTARQRAVAIPKIKGAVCVTEGCELPVEKQGMCQNHYARLRRGIPMDAPMIKLSPKGSGYTHHSGYRILSIDGKRVPEHRYVMERELGRPLDPREEVHHKNGVRDDNDPSNLELWVKPQPSGQRVDDLVQWVVEHYPDLTRKLLQGVTNNGT